jgi:hypothetical protein
MATTTTNDYVGAEHKSGANDKPDDHWNERQTTHRVLGNVDGRCQQA